MESWPTRRGEQDGNFSSTTRGTSSDPSSSTASDDTGDSSGDDTGQGLFGESNASIAAAGSTHEHAVFAVVINGSRIDFSRRHFQLRSRKVHFEHGNGTIIHKHADGVTIDYTLNTLGMDLTGTCLRLGTRYSFCEDGGTLNVTVNGEPVPRWYEYGDGDTVIVSFSHATG